MEGLVVFAATTAAAALFLLGMPILLIIGLWVVAVQLSTDYPMASIGSTMFESLNSFSLLAAPLFILTGDLISSGGIARRMVDFSLAVLGWVRGGLGIAAIGACAMFAAISGSNAATTASIGSISYPAMVRQGYEKHFAAATAAAGGTVGIIIPPSILFIVYGSLVNVPISELFLAGIVPGLMMAAAMMLVCHLVSRRHGYGGTVPFKVGEVARTLPGASVGGAAIVLILWGIYTGVFSPTEASAVAVAYCLFAGFFLSRELTIRTLPAVIFRSSVIVGIIMPLVAVSILMQEILAVIGARQFVEAALSGLGNYYLILGAMMLVILAAGTILESVPVTIILAPIFAPIAAKMGVDPFHFGALFMVGTAIGFITPPYGLNLYVAATITDLPYFKIVGRVWPYLVVLLAVWLLVASIPLISTFLIGGLEGGGLRMLR